MTFSSSQIPRSSEGEVRQKVRWESLFSEKLDTTKILRVRLQRQSDVQIPRLLQQTVQLHVLQLQALR